MPVFEAMGKSITHVGGCGTGQITKAANQIMVAAQMVAMGELLIFAQKAGRRPRESCASNSRRRCAMLDIGCKTTPPVCRQPSAWL